MREEERRGKISEERKYERREEKRRGGPVAPVVQILPSSAVS